MRHLLWFRKDLRLDDHPALTEAAAAAGPDGSRRPGGLVGVVCLDPADFGPTPLGFPRTGPARARFLLEAVEDLRRAFRSRGSDLVVRRGAPERILPEIAARIGATRVVTHVEIASEERSSEDRVRRALREVGATLRRVPGNALFDPAALPFAIDDLPEVFTPFRRAVEKQAGVPDPLPAPDALPALPEGLDPGPVPGLADLGVSSPIDDPRQGLPFAGGATAAHARLDHYLFGSDRVARYKKTRDGLLGADDSTRLSPWLAQGSLSPRRVHAEVRRYERERVANESTYWVVFELLWREYFRLAFAKHGNAFFRSEGLRGDAGPWKRDRESLDRWITSRTGTPLVDAAMRELARTGYLSNRGRQIVASHLVHDLGVDWTWGAQWFESALIDYDVHSNWGNWAYVAGAGNDPRGGRHFDVEAQARRHDPDGRYVRTWGRD